MKTAFLFPGQGNQHKDMLGLIKSSDQHLEYIDMIEGLVGENLLNRMSDESFINKNEISSLLTSLCSICALDQIEGQTPDFYFGYSAGIYSSLYAAGVISLESMFELSLEMSKVMNFCAAQQKSGMLAVIGLSYEKVQELCDQYTAKGAPLYISNYNCLGQVSLSGVRDVFESVKNDLRSMSVRKVVELPCEGAWHSPLIKEGADQFLKYLYETDHFKPSESKVICNVEGDVLPLKDKPKLYERLSKQIDHPIQWEKGMRTLITEGVEEFIEVGYSNTLTKFGFFIDRSLKHTTFQALL